MRYIIIILLGVTVGLSSCDQDISEFNQDPKSPSSVDAEVLFTYGQHNLVKQMVNIDYNHNVDRLWANFLTQTTYIQEASYDAANRDIGGSMWDNIYTESLYELADAKEILIAEDVPDALQAQEDNKYAMILVLEVFAYQYLVDNFGPIPYSEGLDINNVTPAYDQGADVYAAIADSLDKAISMFDPSTTGFSEQGDILYGGDISSWQKFANSLKLKMGMRMADYDEQVASQMVSDAFDAGVFTSNDDNATYTFISNQPYTNPIYDYFFVENRNTDFVLSQTFLDMLEDLSDPRLMAYFSDPVPFPYPVDDNNTKQDTTLTQGEGNFLIYSDVEENDSIVYVETPFTVEAEDSLKNLRVFDGGTYGAAGNAHAELSHIHPDITEPSFPGTIMDYSFVSFTLAEAVERGFISGDAAEYYENGVRASFEKWGLTSAQADAYLAWASFEKWGLTSAQADAYLAQSDVDYSTAPGDYKEKIGRQKYIALYNQGHEAWTEARRLDFPELAVAASNDKPNPNRMIYPTSEVLINTSNYRTAEGMLGEGDATASSIFWDMN